MTDFFVSCEAVIVVGRVAVDQAACHDFFPRLLFQQRRTVLCEGVAGSEDDYGEQDDEGDCEESTHR